MTYRSLLGWRRRGYLPLAVAVVLAAAIPLGLSNQYFLGLLALGVIYMMLNQGWNLVLGVAGVWHFGMLGVYAVGGYASAIFVLRSGGSPWIGLLVGIVAGALVGFLLGLPAGRLRGIYTSLLTFGFAEVVEQVINNDNSGLTGGVFGLSGVPTLFNTSGSTSGARGFVWVGAALVIAGGVLLHIIRNSPWGMAFAAVKNQERRAASMGISPRFFQLSAFALSGGFAGCAGALYVFYYGSIGPTIMGLEPLSLFVTMLAVGGLGSFYGPYLGTAIIVAINAITQPYGSLQVVSLGVILLIVIVAMPRGLLHAGMAIRDRIGTWVREDEDDAIDDDDVAEAGVADTDT